MPEPMPSIATRCGLGGSQPITRVLTGRDKTTQIETPVADRRYGGLHAAAHRQSAAARGARHEPERAPGVGRLEDGGRSTRLVGKLHPQETLADLRIRFGDFEQDSGHIFGLLSAGAAVQIFLAGSHGQHCAGRCMSGTLREPVAGDPRVAGSARTTAPGGYAELCTSTLSRHSVF